MNRIAGCQWVLAVLMAVGQAVSAQTLRIEYFQWTKTHHKDGKVSVMDSESGQFITRTKKVCYDSDKEGFSVENGSIDISCGQAHGTHQFRRRGSIAYR